VALAARSQARAAQMDTKMRMPEAHACGFSSSTSAIFRPEGLMKGFRRIVVSLAALSVVAVADDAGRFIPQSPLDSSERAAHKARLRKIPSISDDVAERMLDDVDTYHAFRDADIYAAYPELRGHERLWLCSNSIMGGATEIAFLADRGENEATLEKVRCNRVKAGINCGEPRRGQYYFRDASQSYFALEGLTFATATQLLETFEAKRVTGLPEWAEPRGLKLTAIRALSADHYRMAFGDGLCSGCFTVFEVRRESKDGHDQLVVQGQPNAGCF
jgi:hypothetical protein